MLLVQGAAPGIGQHVLRLDAIAQPAQHLDLPQAVGVAAAQHRGADGLDGGGGAEQISQHMRLYAGLRVASRQLYRAQHLYPKAAPKRLGLG